MGVYLRVKFEVSSIVLTDFRQEGVVFLPRQCPPPLPQNKPLKSPFISGLRSKIGLEKDFTELNYVEMK